MAELFGKDKRTRSEHIRNVFAEKEFGTIGNYPENSRLVRKEGNRSITRDIAHFNLNVIISVGYRVHSKRGTQFRIWATRILKEYLVRGYALDEARLKEAREKIGALKHAVRLIENVVRRRRSRRTKPPR